MRTRSSEAKAVLNALAEIGRRVGELERLVKELRAEIRKLARMI
jgi:hypothetical protein